ncbi:MAG: hypothetical protein HY287_03060 [Planctomycetes bacterium]|nr:hypothetical protein [Planctomycetota bacterium]
MRNSSSCIRFVIMLSPLMILSAGCAPKHDPLTQDNYRRIQVHASSQDDVRAALGEPTQVLGNQWRYERESKHLNCFIDFDDKGRVTRTQWIDGMNDTNPWHDSSESKSK